MADDMRRAVGELPGSQASASSCTTTCSPRRSTRASPKGLSVQEIFGAEAEADLDDLRETFVVKAFKRRQEALLGHLVGMGCPPEMIVGMTLADLTRFRSRTKVQKPVRRYLERRAVVGPLLHADELAFVDAEGARLTADGLVGLFSPTAAGPHQHGIQRRAVPWAAHRALRSRNARRAEIEASSGRAGIATRALTPELSDGARTRQRATRQ